MRRSVPSLSVLLSRGLLTLKEKARWSRRGLLVSLPIGVGAVATGVISILRSSPADRPGYEEVARWRIPGGEGRFIALGPEPTLEELRALGERLREQFRRLDNVVVMVFDDPEAAREVRRGSRTIGEEAFQAALARQRAMYVKQAARGEHRLVIFDRYPGFREVIRY